MNSHLCVCCSLYIHASPDVKIPPAQSRSQGSVGDLLMALSPADQRALVRTQVDADLSYLWDDSGVELEVQVKFAQAGYKNLRTFVGLADTKPDLRRALSTDFELDPAANGALPRVRQQVACILSAWEGASQMNTKESQLRVEAKTLGVSKPVTVTDRTAMRRVYEAAHGRLPASEQPSPVYLSLKMEEVESEEPTASSLDEVTCADDTATETLSSGLDTTGRIVVTKKRSKGVLPIGPESFRMKLRVEANCWIYLAGKFTSKPWLQNLTPQLWQKYCDHFLGSKCNALEIPDGNGNSGFLRPPWTVVLHYEHQCRKWAFEKVRDENAELGAALLLSIRDPEIKEVHFTSPIALMGRITKGTPPAPHAADDPLEEVGKKRKRARGRGKGAAAVPKGQGKGREAKGKGKGKGPQLVSKTPDGREICYNFNNESGCALGNGCARVHTCRVRGCTESHSMQNHTA